MGRLKKKGEEGNATKYITRAGAVKRLQVSLKAFRRLCILKGIYPREAPSAATRSHGKDKTYYLVKDIRYLAHDPLVDQLRREKVHRRREARAKGRGESRKAITALRKARPHLSLEHIIRERYPTFNDAVRELDDVLCMVALFADLAAAGKIQPSRVATCKRLVAEFEEYVVAAGALEKVFFSVKGVYYEARIAGERVRWQAPLTFAPRVPKDVDLRVMLSFLELYTTLLAFVNFKLYHGAALAYPPNLAELRAAPPADGRLFSGMHFYLNREVPHTALTFIARAYGARVTVAEEAEADESITHHVSERPVLKRRFLSREYIVPQWLADSANNAVALPVDDYSPERAPPPHLSPFVDDAAEGYVPERAEQLRALVARLKRTDAPAAAGEAADEAPADDDAEEAEARLLREAQEREAAHMAELKAEQSGKGKKGKKTAKEAEAEAAEAEAATGDAAEEEDEASDEGSSSSEAQAAAGGAEARKAAAKDADSLRAIMLPKKKRRLYERVQHSQAAKKAVGETLMRKRQTLRSSGGM